MTDTLKRGTTGRPIVLLFALTSFLSSGLLFLVQPMVAKSVLPLFGGSPSVWNVCMVFFQTALLLGYVYSHGSWHRLRLRQPWLHMFLLLVPLLLLPITIPNWAAPPTDVSTALWLLVVLGATVGAPFFMVATSAPLLQAWFSTTTHNRADDPYFLYAAGNTGSLLALLSYPLVLEPTMTLGSQKRVWAGGYVVLVVLFAVCAVVAHQRRNSDSRSIAAVKAEKGPEKNLKADGIRVTYRQRGWWLMLSALPSSLLLGVTTFITTDIAAVPLLWVLPLSLYLFTFILAFGHTRKKSEIVLPIAVTTAAATLLPGLESSGGLVLEMLLHLGLFTALAYACHGRLAELRPPVFHLTQFYLFISLGGVLGGAFTSLVAPIVFDHATEYGLALAATLAALFVKRTAISERTRIPKSGIVFASLPFLIILGVFALRGELSDIRLIRLTVILAIAATALAVLRPSFVAAAVGGIVMIVSFLPNNALLSDRSFFGVYEVNRSASIFNELSHGSTVHGVQNTQAPMEPLSYYGKDGPLGDVFATRGNDDKTWRVAVVGLGTGTIATYGKANDTFTFFEIDPLVARIAENPRYFTYLRDTPARVQIVLGDGRLRLADVADGSYDMIVLDAFSSDAIPAHLLSAEAFRLYESKLAPGGVIAANISNRYLNLEPVLEGAGRRTGMHAIIRRDGEDNPETRKGASDWVAVGKDSVRFQQLQGTVGWRPAQFKSGATWTDDYSNIVSTLN